MGTPRWSSDDWTSYKKEKIDHKTDSEIFSSRSIRKDLDPLNIKFRESCDSALNPNSTPIILAFDVTGSMGHIAKQMAREGIKTTIEQILDRKPVSDPHIMVMGVGDAEAGDKAPLQVSQFETDTKIIEQLSQIYLEGGGGCNDHESYNMPWYFAATKTKIDCFEKRGKKGILFTMGDEEPAMVLRRQDVKKYIGDDLQYDIPTSELLALVQQKYDIFHIVVEEGNYASTIGADKVVANWNNVLGQGHVIRLQDHTKLPEVIVSTLQVHAGENIDDVTKSWDGDTSMVVAHAVHSMAKSSHKNAGGIVRFG